jgi:ankyrin repeat protein
MKGHKDVAELLLANQAEVNAKDNYGGTPLHAAAVGGYKDVVELLLANKAGVNAKNNDGWTPLHEAAMSGQKDVAELLLANQADVNARNNKGETPLRMVLAEATDSRYQPERELGKRNLEMTQWLRQHGGHE